MARGGIDALILRHRTWNTARFAPDHEGGSQSGTALDVGIKVARISTVAHSRPPWGAGSDANRIAGRSGAQFVQQRNPVSGK
ncbi:hypothetical protein Z950_1569 [Sulfitobacter mediterraneus KCTC 32188]|nr:hypothetical protein Z950_1569 [Sulfitobacter mediterraneus KCTC 32188]